MRLPLDIVKLIISYFPSKTLLPWIQSLLATTEASDCVEYFWANPNVFKAGIFSESELPTAPKHLIAGNPACASYIIAHWDMFRNISVAWRNAALWECLKTELNPTRVWQFSRNPHPDAVLYMQQNGIAIHRTNPAFIFTQNEFADNGAKMDQSTWANPSAVSFLQKLVANNVRPCFSWLRENSHPWAIHELSKSHDLWLYGRPQFEELFRNEGIFESVDFRPLQCLLSEIGVCSVS